MDDPTPVDVGVKDPCQTCDVVPLVRIKNDVLAPTCAREAEAFMTCVSTNDGGWSVCAVKRIAVLGGYKWYFGPERRVTPLGLPGMTDRRKASAA